MKTSKSRLWFILRSVLCFQGMEFTFSNEVYFAVEIFYINWIDKGTMLW